MAILHLYCTYITHTTIRTISTQGERWHGRHDLPHGLEEGTGGADVPLQGGPAGEVAGPVLVRAVRVGEEVVLLQRPREALRILGGAVCLRRGVEQVDSPVGVAAGGGWWGWAGGGVGMIRDRGWVEHL